jgi:2-oxo-3-hexenedioate decarboxylase
MTAESRSGIDRCDELAGEVLAALDARRQIGPLSGRPGGLALPDAYAIAAAVRRRREERGEAVLGRKIGFTNTTIWDEYDVHAPIWGYVYATTVHDLAEVSGGFGIAHLAEPRIEPEIVFELERVPEPGMDERALVDCIGSVAHGFEIVQSLFPGWRFAAADTVAAFGLHGALLVGPKRAIPAGERDEWHERLARFEIVLQRNGADVDLGRASHVLGSGPLGALRHLVGVLANDHHNPPLAAGEIVTTGTVTRAFPVSPGERWTTRLSGLPLPDIGATFVEAT